MDLHIVREEMYFRVIGVLKFIFLDYHVAWDTNIRKIGFQFFLQKSGLFRQNSKSREQNHVKTC